jgi:cell division protein FtsZ
MTNPIIVFDLEKKISRLIKVIGVGGAGSNAVNFMFTEQKLPYVDYIVCNTDLQALENSMVPHKIQIGKELTDGLGAGSKPETGKKAVLENLDELEKKLKDQTKMLFITAGMGGGTGTGAAPEIAKLAHNLGILTVAVVTTPFKYEGPQRLKSAAKGIEELRKYVDSLLIVDNEKLINVYGDLPYKEAFNKSDEVLAKAVESVTRVITKNYHINVDFNDVETILRNSGTALIGTAVSEGTDRAEKVIRKALDSPLLNHNNIEGAKNVLLLIVSGTQTATVKEIDLINNYIRKKTRNDVNIIMGLGEDPSLQRKLSVTVIATGFPVEKQERIHNKNIPDLVIQVPTGETDEDEKEDLLFTEPTEEKKPEDHFHKEWSLFEQTYGKAINTEEQTNNEKPKPQTVSENHAPDKTESGAVNTHQATEMNLFTQQDIRQNTGISDEPLVREIHTLDEKENEQLLQRFSETEQSAAPETERPARQRRDIRSKIIKADDELKQKLENYQYRFKNNPIDPTTSHYIYQKGKSMRLGDSDSYLNQKFD